MFKKILAAIDLTESQMTKQAIDKAAALARAFNSELRLVNVQTLIPVAFLDYVKGDFDTDIRLGIEEEITALAASVDYAKERVSTVVLFGPVYQKILTEAEEWGAEVVVVGSHRPGMDRFLIGSNAGAIVHHAKCSVLVVRQ
jgi:universal stress protein F